MVQATSEGGGWLPASRSTGSRLLHHAVDLLQRQTLGLGDEEVGVDEGASAKTTPHEEDARLQVAVSLTNHVGCNDGNNGVPQPVGGGGQGDTTGTDGQGEDLANQDPGAGAPGGSEKEDEDGDEGDLSVHGRDVVGNGRVGVRGVWVGVVETDRNTNDSDEELADKHTKGTDNEDEATAEPLDGPEGDRGGADVDEREDQRDKEGVADGAGGLQEGRGVVEDEVDTGPLLHHLEGGTEDGATQVRLCGPQGPLEAVRP